MLKNKNPGTRDLIPDLMGGPSRVDTLRPEATPLRALLTSTGIRSSYVIPGDWPVKPERWYASSTNSYPTRTVNSVEYLIDGRPTFEAMLEAIETANEPEHFIVLLGWAAYLDFRLVEESARTSLAGLTGFEIFKKKTEEGVKVRLLLWNNNAPTEFDAWGVRNNVLQKWQLDRLNPPEPAPEETPPRAICILDDNTYSMGSHHQKILLVSGSEGLIGFFGGIDLAADRVNRENVRLWVGPAFQDVGGPLHDVHARVTGQAAHDLMVLAINRWNLSKPAPAYMGPLAGATSASIDTPADRLPANMAAGRDPAYPRAWQADAAPSKGRNIEDLGELARSALARPIRLATPTHIVRVGQTVGNPDLHKAEGHTTQSDAWPAIQQAIRAASKFIYVEDQYLWSKDAAKELAAALPNIRHLTILIAPDDPVNGSLRHEFVDMLYEQAGSEEARRKIGIFTRRVPDHQYVHAKMFIMDDELAIIGSANCNNRGYFHDSEVIGLVADPAWEQEDGPREGKWHRLELNLAHKLRIELWAEHLKMQPDELVDGVAAVTHWSRPPLSANVNPYWYKPGSIEPIQGVKSLLFDWTVVDPR